MEPFLVGIDDYMSSVGRTHNDQRLGDGERRAPIRKTNFDDRRRSLDNQKIPESIAVGIGNRDTLEVASGANLTRARRRQSPTRRPDPSNRSFVAHTVSMCAGEAVVYLRRPQPDWRRYRSQHTRTLKGTGAKRLACRVGLSFSKSLTSGRPAPEIRLYPEISAGVGRCRPMSAEKPVCGVKAHGDSRNDREGVAWPGRCKNASLFGSPYHSTSSSDPAKSKR